MATAADFISELAAKVQTLGNAAAYERIGGDYRSNERPSAWDRVGYKIRVNYVEEDAQRNANVVYKGVTCELEMVGGRLDFADERQYTEGVALLDQAALIDHAWWRAMASVYGFWGQLQVSAQMERVGKFYPYTVTAEIVLKP